MRNASLLKCLGLVRGLAKKGKYNVSSFRKAILKATESKYYSVLHANVRDYLLVMKLYRRNHKDMIDNLLYAAALNNACQFLTIDGTLEQFIETQNIENVILTPETF
ncbi:MAG: hypothetical protein ACTSVT_08180 [Candidatus Thorarchaeota archaeon]